MDKFKGICQVIVRNVRTPISATEADAMEQAQKRVAPLLRKRDIISASVFKRSLDARRRSKLSFIYTILLDCSVSVKPEALARFDAAILLDSTVSFTPGTEASLGRPVVCGFGPCGMFCALLLAEHGYKPIVIERGSSVTARAEDVARFYRTGILDPESNIQFGAGGAGTFSDGKLVTRINDPRCRYVLERLCEFGAPSDVLTKAKPHVGTDKLLGVVSAIARRIEELGGEIRFKTRLESINVSSGRAVSINTSAGEIPCGALVLAIGHSARDTYEYLMHSNFDVTPKPFSVGVRIEHLQSDIDRALFGDEAGNPVLGHGEYALSKRVKENGRDRAVYTFCMCPGGEVVAAASEECGVVTNGMSSYSRSGANANSAIAVSVECDDPIGFQRSLERAAFAAGGGGFRAPAQTVGDFLAGKRGTEPKRILPTYMGSGKVELCDLGKLLPKDITSMMRLGLADFDRKLPGFACPDAVLTGFETRTSAPVRILRTDAMLANGYDNIYPCGEGAGYAGGITSAAVDGIACAGKIITRYRA